MAGQRDSPMDGIVDADDNIINRINLQLARSRSILNSWVPQNNGTEDQQDGLPDNDPDFAPSRENAGIDSKSTYDDESALPTKRSIQKDKLLEQLIGKKAAAAKRKEDAHKSMSASKHAAPKSATNGGKQGKREEESDEEEEGRAAAFKSKKLKKSDAAPVPAGEEDDPEIEDAKNDESRARSLADTQPAPAKEESVSPEPQPQKRKGGGSYLDELLAKKAKKKSTKKQKA